MEIQKARHQHNLERWRELILECRSSGMSVRSWCSQQGISPQTYYRWQRQVWDTEVRQAQEKGLIATGFTEVQLAQSASTALTGGSCSEGQLRITVGGVQITVDGSYPPERLAALLRELRGLC